MSKIITIGRQYGSGGREIGKKLAENMGIPFYDNELITIASKESGMSQELFENIDGNRGDENNYYPLMCYELILSKTKLEQEVIYKIIVDIDKYKSL